MKSKHFDFFFAEVFPLYGWDWKIMIFSFFAKSYFTYRGWNQNIPIFSNTPAITNGYTFTAYSEPVDDMVISTGIYTAAVNSLSDDDVRVSQRLYAPSSRLRGFKSGSVGPKDGSDFVGGNYIATFNTSSTIPYILQTMESVDLKVFLPFLGIFKFFFSTVLAFRVYSCLSGCGMPSFFFGPTFFHFGT